jgi:hypothetical protein
MRAGCWLSLLLLLAPLSAQALGDRVPDLKADAWVCGAPPKPADNDVHLLAIASYRTVSALLLDADHLAELQLHSGAAGLRCIALVCATPSKPLRERFAIGVVGEDYATGLNGGELACGNVALVSPDGVVLWTGRPEHGLQCAVKQALAGELDAATLTEVAGMRQYLLGDLADVPLAAVLASTETALRANSEDGVGRGLAAAALIEKGGDRKAIKTCLAEGCAALGSAPAALREFADLALRSYPSSRDVAQTLAVALSQVAPVAPRDLRLQLVLLRALVRAGRDKEVPRLAGQVLKASADDATALLTLAETLADAADARPYAALALQALQAARGLSAEPTLQAMVEHKVKLLCAADTAGADALVDALVRELASHTSINNEAWYLMTRVETRGRFDQLAGALMARLQVRGDLQDFECDTSALAAFRLGRSEQAVQWAERAVALCTVDGVVRKTGYADRLVHYRLALPAPR